MDSENLVLRLVLDRTCKKFLGLDLLKVKSTTQAQKNEQALDPDTIEDIKSDADKKLKYMVYFITLLQKITTYLQTADAFPELMEVCAQLFCKECSDVSDFDLFTASEKFRNIFVKTIRHHTHKGNIPDEHRQKCLMYLRQHGAFNEDIDEDIEKYETFDKHQCYEDCCEVLDTDVYKPKSAKLPEVMNKADRQKTINSKIVRNLNEQQLGPLIQLGAEIQVPDPIKVEVVGDEAMEGEETVVPKRGKSVFERPEHIKNRYKWWEDKTDEKLTSTEGIENYDSEPISGARASRRNPQDKRKPTIPKAAEAKKTKRVLFTDEESIYILVGFIYGGGGPNVWVNILERFRTKFHSTRDNVNLKDRYRSMQKLGLDKTLLPEDYTKKE